MKKLICAALAAMCVGTLFSGCTNAKTPPEGFLAPPEIGFMAAAQFEGYKLGTVPSLVPESTIENELPGAYVLTYKNPTKGLHALTEKDIHGMVLPVLYADEEIKKTPGIEKIELTFIEKKISAILLNDSNFVLPVDAAITSLNGSKKSHKIALSHSPYATDENAYTRPTDYEKAPGRVLRVGISSNDNAPYNYHENGELVGVNVDMAYEFAAFANADLEIKEYPKDKLEEALRNKEVDVILADFVLDETKYEEKEFSGLLFSDSYSDASIVIVVKSEYVGHSKDILAQLEAGQIAE